MNPSKSAAERAGKPGVQGHFHRHRYWQVKNRSVQFDFWTLGAMCRLDPEYLPFNDWSNSFGYLEQIVGSDRYAFHAISVIDGQFIFGGKLYTGEGVFECR